MRLNDLLRSDNISLVESSYAALKEIEFSKYILQEMRKKQLEVVALLVCRSNTRILGIAFKNKFWTLLTDVVNMNPEFGGCALDFFEEARTSKKMIFYLTKSELHETILFILSSVLLSGNNCECTIKQRSYALAYSLERHERIRTLFKTKLELMYDLSKYKILEICCGNGMGTAALRALGYNVFALDNDKCSVCEGLYHGILEMDKTVVLDASTISQYEFFNSQNFNCVIGFMLGSIYEFNKSSWQEILAEAVSIVSRGIFIFTVHKKEEVDFVYHAMTNLGLKGEIIDNRDTSGIYDQWVYTGKKE
jgi:SAM-dependent methyltransferase